MQQGVYNVGGYCCKKGLTAEETLTFSYWTQVKDCLNEQSLDAYSKELFGYDSECAFNKVNNFHYLLDYLLYVNWYWGVYSTLTEAEIKTLFSIDCIVKSFRCCGCNISKALAVFGLSESTVTANPSYSG